MKRINICNCSQSSKKCPKIKSEHRYIVEIKDDDKCAYCGHYVYVKYVRDSWTPDQGLALLVTQEIRPRTNPFGI